jgi:hypothetical protein
LNIAAIAGISKPHDVQGRRGKPRPSSFHHEPRFPATFLLLTTPALAGSRDRLVVTGNCTGQQRQAGEVIIEPAKLSEHHREDDT